MGNPGRPPGRTWYYGRADLLARLAQHAAAIADDPSQPPLTLRATALHMGRGLRTVQEAMDDEGLTWQPIKRDALRRRFSHLSRTFAA
jgi:hypothetical protein